MVHINYPRGEITLFREKRLHRGEALSSFWQSSNDLSDNFGLVSREGWHFPFKTIQPRKSAVEVTSDGKDLQAVGNC